MRRVVEWLHEHPWFWLVFGLLCMLEFIWGFNVGKHSTPARVETKTVVRTVVKEDTEAREQVRTLTEQLQTLKRDTHVERIIVTKRDGTRVQRIVTDTHVDKSTSTHEDTSTLKQVASHVEASQQSTSTVVTINNKPPNWFVGPLVVFVPTAPIGQQLNGGLVVGRRLFGPFVASVSASVPTSKPLSLPSLGLSLTVGF